MTETGILAIKAAIKTALSDPSLSKISKWLSAEPSPSSYPSLCFGWVEWAGGTIERSSSDSRKKVDDFYIVIVTKNPDADVAESDGLVLGESVEALFSASPNLGGSVTDSMVTQREKQKVFEGKYSINAIRLTLHTWHWI
jgi:hypothetical protein